MEIKVLDHGYVKLIESYGSDRSVIEAAKMSTQKEWRGWEEGEAKLLKFLYDHKHMTPFEMCGMIIEVKAPIFIFREWHRHRTQCLSGDTKITLVSPRGTTYKRTIKQIYDLKYGGVIDSAPSLHKNGTSKVGTPVLRKARRKNTWRTRVLPNCQDRMLRVLDENTGLFHVARMKDVWESGVKQLYKVNAGNYSVTSSAEHPFFTKRGWVKCRDLRIGDEIARMGKVANSDRPIPPSLRSGIGVWTSMIRSRIIKNKETSECYKCFKLFKSKNMQLDHVIPVKDNLKLALDEGNLKLICGTCHLSKTALEQPNRVKKTRRGVCWEKVNSRIQAGEDQTYDIEVEGSNHNYLANHLVVHNSYNEMSARYIPLPDENYIPTADRVVQGSKKTSNKQASGSRELSETEANLWIKNLKDTYEKSQNVYSWAVDGGVPKELARLCVPVGRYSAMRASSNLRNWLAFLTLRMDKNAQWEIQQYANAVGELIEANFPRTWELFLKEE